MATAASLISQLKKRCISFIFLLWSTLIVAQVTAGEADRVLALFISALSIQYTVYFREILRLACSKCRVLDAQTHVGLLATLTKPKGLGQSWGLESSSGNPIGLGKSDVVHQLTQTQHTFKGLGIVISDDLAEILCDMVWAVLIQQQHQLSRHINPTSASGAWALFFPLCVTDKWISFSC